MKNNYPSRKVVVPGKTLNEISKILSGEVEDQVKIFFTDNHIVFEFDDTVVVSRLIEGEYFRIDQMLSSDYETKVKVNKKELLNCIDRATLLIRESDKKPIIVQISDGNMRRIKFGGLIYIARSVHLGRERKRCDDSRGSRLDPASSGGGSEQPHSVPNHALHAFISV